METRINNKRVKVFMILSMIVVALAFFMVSFHRNTPGVMRDELIEAFGMNGTTFGLFSSMYFYPYMLAQIPVGMLLDSIGAKKTIGICSALAAFGALLFGISGSYVLACIGRVFIGVGVAAPVTSTQAFLIKWLGQGKTASAYGVFSFFGKLGGMFAQLPLAFLLERTGWRSVFFICASMSIIVAILCFVLVKDSPEEAMGLKVTDVNKQKKTLKSLLSAMGHVLSNRFLWMMFIVMFIHQSLYNLFSSTWSTPYLQDSFGLVKTEAAAYSTVMSVGAMVFSLIAGFISDRLFKSRTKYIALTSIVLTVVWTLLGFAGGFLMKTHLLWPVMFLMGIGASDIQIIFAYSREMNDPQYIGVSVSTSNMIGMLGSAIMPTVFGSMLDSYAAKGYAGAELYRMVFIPCIILMFITVFLTIFSKDTKCRNRYTELHPQKAKSN